MTVNKALGQHWLNNRIILDEIASLCVQGADGQKDLCIEIGPGLGTLTASLFKKFKRVIAVEFDVELARKLPGSFPGKNLEVVCEDILKYNFENISGEYYVAGNIPYYITSPIVEKIIRLKNPPKRAVLLMQKEVAERICAEKESVLSLVVKNYANCYLGSVVSRDEFSPPPKVDSRILVLEPFTNGAKYPDELMRMIKVAFAAPRKKIVHNLAGYRNREELKQILERLNLNINARPADLHLDDYFRLYCAIM